MHIEAMTLIPNRFKASIPPGTCHPRTVAPIALAAGLASALITDLLSTPVMAEAPAATDSLPSPDSDALDPQVCDEQIDAQVARAENATADLADIERRLQHLDELCPGRAEIAHDIAVLAARQGQEQQALAAFERALSLYPEAYHTWQQMRALQTHRADRSLAAALSLEATPGTPMLELQQANRDRRRNTADTTGQAGQFDGKDAELQIDYELYAWWQERHDNESIAHYYVPGMPTALHGHVLGAFDGSLDWSQLTRRIDVLDDTAVVLISDQDTTRALLLMRPEGGRWLIEHEQLL
ncbi:MAG: hypothetical protein CSB44_07040 [Gammaproteobacteria bacterium]|nr:MAG: hypothetical protein CSB44_07040 [Gammaproteobacteria bacterium]